MIRLLNAGTRTLAPKTRVTPHYAILSHRWGSKKDEITFQQVDLEDHTEFKDKPGYKKIVGFCDFALSLGLHYVWADTCCIDKKDYNAQSTALGYMFQWYRDAQVCCVYLDDVVEDEDPAAQDSQFRNSQWFTRGWTLQELIAPRQVVFFNKSWKEIGTKSSLIDTITEITNILSNDILMNHPGEMSIAQRMSWAAGRETSFVEDRAYSLMGLLGVSIPMLYGEGEKAFERLQLEIIKTSDDQSIFAWIGDENRGPSGLLAKSPDDFRRSHDICQVIDTNPDPAPYGMTNKGLRINLYLEPHPTIDDVNWATLSCRRADSASLLRILLKYDSPRPYTRVNLHQLEPGNSTSESVTEIYVKERVKTRFEISDWMRIETPCLFVVGHMVASDADIVGPNCDNVNWSRDEGFLLTLQESGHSGVLAFRDAGTKKRLEICIGVHNHNAWCWILQDPATPFEEFWKTEGIHNERWKNRDRQTLAIDGDKTVSVALTRGLLSTGEELQRGCWYVDIKFTRDSSYALTQLGYGCCYQM